MRRWRGSRRSEEQANPVLPRAGGAANPRFAVIDCETTGLNPNAHHRMVELAIIEVDDLGTPGAAWSTVLDPGRDLGDAGIHGIRGRDVVGAPRLADVAGSILSRLRGRVVVAHNARFDCAFIESEFAAAGYDIAPLIRACTIDLAQRSGAGAGGYSLGACCQEAGIAVEGAHQALTDARACEALLCAYAGGEQSHCRELLTGLSQQALARAQSWPEAAEAADPRPREQLRSLARGKQPDFLTKLADAPKAVDVGARIGAGAIAYLELLDRALEDRRLSAAEREDLVALAQLYDLSRPEVELLHGAYIDGSCRAAAADAVITERELYDLSLVAEGLGVGDIEARLEAAIAEVGAASGGGDRAAAKELEGLESDELAGMSVCFTGTLLCRHQGEAETRERACELAIAAGLVPAPRVTKDLDLLVIADPESQSGKARKAREYGVRIVAEARFWPMIGIEVS